MYTIEKTDFGLHVVFDGFLQKGDMEAWKTEVEATINGKRQEFGAVVDLRGAKAFPADAQQVLFEAIENLRERGLGRQSVVVASSIIKIQATRMAKHLGMYDVVRFLDASSIDDWEKISVDWAARGIDPD